MLFLPCGAVCNAELIAKVTSAGSMSTVHPHTQRGPNRAPRAPHGPMGPQGPHAPHGAFLGPLGPQGPLRGHRGTQGKPPEPPRGSGSIFGTPRILASGRPPGGLRAASRRPASRRPLWPPRRPLWPPQRPLWPPQRPLWPPQRGTQRLNCAIRCRYGISNAFWERVRYILGPTRSIRANSRPIWLIQTHPGPIQAHPGPMRSHPGPLWTNQAQGSPWLAKPEGPIRVHSRPIWAHPDPSWAHPAPS